MLLGISGWLGYGFGIASIVSEEWIYYDNDGTPTREGVWYVKENYGMDNSTGGSVERSPWLDATCGMYIAGLVLAWIAVMTFGFIGCCKDNALSWLKADWVMLFMAVPFEVAAMTIYTTSVQGGYAGSGNPWGTVMVAWKWGYAYQLGWAAAGCNLFCLLLLTRFVRKGMSYDDCD